MLHERTVEQRLTAIEAQLAAIEARLERIDPKGHWIERMVGSMEGIPGFEEMTRLGAEFRHADRPDDLHD